MTGWNVFGANGGNGDVWASRDVSTIAGLAGGERWDRKGRRPGCCEKELWIIRPCFYQKNALISVHGPDRSLLDSGFFNHYVTMADLF